MDTEGTAFGAGTVAAIGRGLSTLGAGAGRSGLGGSNTLRDARTGRGVPKSEDRRGRCSE